MIANTLVLRLAAVVALVGGIAVSQGAAAQQKEMTAEELEQYVMEQRKALEEVIRNREETDTKLQQIQEALNEQESRRQRVEDELKRLCEEQAVLEPGSLEKCLSDINN